MCNNCVRNAAAVRCNNFSVCLTLLKIHQIVVVTRIFLHTWRRYWQHNLYAMLPNADLISFHNTYLATFFRTKMRCNAEWPIIRPETIDNQKPPLTWINGWTRCRLASRRRRGNCGKTHKTENGLGSVATIRDKWKNKKSRKWQYYEMYECDF